LTRACVGVLSIIELKNARWNTEILLYLQRDWLKKNTICGDCSADEGTNFESCMLSDWTTFPDFINSTWHVISTTHFSTKWCGKINCLRCFIGAAELCISILQRKAAYKLSLQDMLQCILGYFEPWRWDQYIDSKLHVPVTQWHHVIFQNNRYLQVLLVENHSIS